MGHILQPDSDCSDFVIISLIRIHFKSSRNKLAQVFNGREEEEEEGGCGVWKETRNYQLIVNKNGKETKTTTRNNKYNNYTNSEWCLSYAFPGDGESIMCTL